MNFGNMQKLMKQAEAMQAKMQEMQEGLKTREFEGVSGAGAVKVVLKGGAMMSIKIDPSLVDINDVEMLEDLVITAHNNAKKQYDETADTDMNSAMGGLKLPGDMKFPF